MQFNREQNKIFEFVENEIGSLVVEARAGTGKTTTGVEACNRIDADKSITFVAFNKSIAEELKWKVSSNVRAMTSHSMGFRSLMFANKKIKVDQNKCRNIYRQRDFNPALEGSTMQLVSLGKTTDTRYPDLDQLLNYYDINAEADYLETIVEQAKDVLDESLNNMDVIDFDDMIYLPALGRSRLYPVDYLFVDEAQDMNAAQLAMFRRAMKFESRLIAIGDRNQSIYGFRGADVEAIPRIISEFDAKRLPLSTCYRCAESIIQLAQQIVPEIQPKPNAPKGEIHNIISDRIFDKAKSGDLILCRINAPLVNYALSFISRGIKAQVLGRDIGKSLLSLMSKILKRYTADSVVDFLRALQEYTYTETAKLLAAEKYSMAGALEDKSETLIVLCSHAKTLDDIPVLIEKIFSDEIYGITLSSIHKAKGMEADSVFILRPDLLPYPKAKGWQLQQELNLKYVAITRAKNELTFVEGF